MSMYLGIDPGLKGGLAYVEDGRIGFIKMPSVESDIWNWLTEIKFAVNFAVIEKVSGYIGEDQPGSRSFKFGQSYGSLRMALTAAHIPFDEVSPQKWQKALGITPRDLKREETKTSFKNRLKQKACQFYPGEKITLAVCDAILLATYCQRWKEGKL